MCDTGKNATYARGGTNEAVAGGRLEVLDSFTAWSVGLGGGMAG